jgi:hypothetical protein
MSSAKQDVAQLLNKLPDDCSVEDIQYHLYVLEKVRRGLDDAKANGTLSQEGLRPNGGESNCEPDENAREVSACWTKGAGVR